MRIRVASTIDRFARNMDDAGRKHVPFAAARALTWTAKDAQGVVKGGLGERFTLRSGKLVSTFRINPATKTNLEATVGTLAQAMRLQETGGTKTAGGHRVAVPVKVRRTKSDSISAGNRPKALRGKPRVFTITKGSGTAIVRREGKARYPLQILYWLKRGVKLKPRLGFQGTTSTSVEQRFGPNWIESISQAMGKG